MKAMKALEKDERFADYQGVRSMTDTKENIRES